MVGVYVWCIVYIGYNLINRCNQYFIGLVELIQDGVGHPLECAGVLSCVQHLLYLEAVGHGANWFGLKLCGTASSPQSIV